MNNAHIDIEVLKYGTYYHCVTPVENRRNLNYVNFGGWTIFNQISFFWNDGYENTDVHEFFEFCENRKVIFISSPSIGDKCDPTMFHKDMLFMRGIFFGSGGREDVYPGTVRGSSYNVPCCDISDVKNILNKSIFLDRWYVSFGDGWGNNYKKKQTEQEVGAPANIVTPNIIYQDNIIADKNNLYVIQNPKNLNSKNGSLALCLSRVSFNGKNISLGQLKQRNQELLFTEKICNKL